jgi:2-amino-4-hydroxy-6-hydroxymethyldihydropteridine diphosphokinase
MEVVYIALGSNLDNPLLHIERALSEIKLFPNTEIESISSCYRSPFWGDDNQPDCINMVMCLKTLLSANELLILLLFLEQLHQRIRSKVNGARTLDCDILLYGQQVIQHKTLIVPHPRMTTRPFVLVPLAEIAPTMVLPMGFTVLDYLQKCDTSKVIKLTNAYAYSHSSLTVSREVNAVL